MLSLAEFIAQHQGQCLTYPNFSPCCQCTDLAAFWSANLGLPVFSGNASTYATERDPPWAWVANTPSGVPSPGDLVVFHECSGEGIGADGHVSIFVSGDVNSFTSFDQNWPDVGGPCPGGGSACHEVSHDYSCVAGWQHQTVLSTPTPTPSPIPIPSPFPSPTPVQPPPPLGLNWEALVGYGAVLVGGAAVGVYFLHREGGSVRELRDKYLGQLAPPGTGFQRRRGEWRTEREEAAIFGKRVAEAQGYDLPARHRPQRSRPVGGRTTGRYRTLEVESPVAFERTPQGWEATIQGPHGELVGRGEGQSQPLASQAALRSVHSRELLHRLDRYRRR